MRMIMKAILAAFVFIMLSAVASSQETSWTDAVDGAIKKEGLVTFYVDKDDNRILFELPSAGDDDIIGRYVYAAGVTGGMGSNPLGIDRSTGLTSHILVFRRAGNRVFAEYENSSFSASGSQAERLAVENSFARSVVWGGDILSQSGDKILLDITSFLVRDSGNLIGRLRGAGQGAFSVDQGLSWLDRSEAHAFPTNVEFDAYVTFKSSQPGRELQATAPDPGKATLIIHSSFMKLPDDSYSPRKWDERAGLIGTTFVDMSTPLGEGVITRLARRWHLEKINPGEAPSKVKKPIVYYVDNSVPEPIMSALLDGARWWEAAFEAAGFIDAYRVEILPEGVHPLDARYNVINWVHRATRGWSYGWGVADPRTGQMMKGFVLLGSLRVRQDIKIFEGLAGTAKTGSGDADDPIEVALARIRQLSAHEVGHTLGFAHNMGASSYMDRASVMDYPAPDVRVKNGNTLDFSKAYTVGMGEWDKWATRYMYAHFDNEEVGLSALISEANDRDLRYVSDSDSRGVGTAHIHGALWDNGSDPVQALIDTLKVRQIALDNFGIKNIREGESTWDLQTKFVPIYLYHRYQLLAAAKALGGMDFEYTRRGDAREIATMVPKETSVAALEAMMSSLSKDALDLSAEQIMLLSPRGESVGDQQFARESFASQTGPSFDHMAAVQAAADLAFGMILHPQRMNRMAQFKAMNDNVLGPKETLVIIGRGLGIDPMAEDLSLLNQTVYRSLINAMMRLHASEESQLAVKSVFGGALYKLSDIPIDRKVPEWFKETLRTVSDYLDGKPGAGAPAIAKPAAIPPGSPIGSAQDCWHCDTFELAG